MIDIWHQYGPALLSGLGVTVELLCASTAMAMLIGLVGAVLVLWGPRFLRVLTSIYIQFIRSTPAVVILFIVFYGLPEVGIILPVFAAAAVALAFYGGAYFVEIIRGGFIAVDPGQWEAGYALGLKRVAILQKVIVPQAVPTMLPPAVNMIADLLKATSLVVVIGMGDLMNEAYIAVSESYRAMEIFAVAGAMYLAIALPLIWLIGKLERAAARYRTRERVQA